MDFKVEEKEKKNKVNIYSLNEGQQKMFPSTNTELTDVQRIVQEQADLRNEANVSSRGSPYTTQCFLHIGKKQAQSLTQAIKSLK